VIDPDTRLDVEALVADRLVIVADVRKVRPVNVLSPANV
jgi:hypothetical protein